MVFDRHPASTANKTAGSLTDKGMEQYLQQTHNIAPEHLLEGHELYIQQGAGPLKKKKEIEPLNLLAQLMTYRELHIKSGRVADMKPDQLLARMFRTGKYFPSLEWADRGQGRGMNEAKFTAIMEVITHTELCTTSIVRTIIYDDGADDDST